MLGMVRRHRGWQILAVAAVMCASMAVLAVSASGASSTRSCSGTVKSSTPGVILIANRITAAGRIGCPSARTVVHAYLHAKLADRTERCAGEAVNPPFRGCRVGRYLCRATAIGGASGQPQLCSTAGIRVRFWERDKSVG